MADTMIEFNMDVQIGIEFNGGLGEFDSDFDECSFNIDNLAPPVEFDDNFFKTIENVFFKPEVIDLTQDSEDEDCSNEEDDEYYVSQYTTDNGDRVYEVCMKSIQ